MKKVLMLLALICITLSFANAQGAKKQNYTSTPEKRAENRAQNLKRHLQLSDQQTKQLQAVFQRGRRFAGYVGQLHGESR